MRSSKMTMRDVASAAKVSVSTVSLALNDTGRLDPATRQHVKDVAERMGYSVNHAARNLRRGRSGILVISVSLEAELLENQSGMEYYVSICHAATSRAAEAGYMLLMAPFGADAASIGVLPLEGSIVLDPKRDDPLLKRLRAGQVPIVTIGRDPAASLRRSWWVDIDLRALVTATLDHLAEQGAESITLLTSDQQRSYLLDTQEAYLAWMDAHGRKPQLVELSGASTEEAGYLSAKHILKAKRHPDAIYTPIDRFALGALRAALGSGLRVPDDLLIACGNDTSLTRLAPVPITSLALPANELGRLATELLLKRLDGESPTQAVAEQSELRVRLSSSRK